jgi:hypothetical protein
VSCPCVSDRFVVGPCADDWPTPPHSARTQSYDTARREQSVRHTVNSCVDYQSQHDASTFARRTLFPRRFENTENNVFYMTWKKTESVIPTYQSLESHIVPFRLHCLAAGGAAALFDLTPPVGTDRACCAVREEYVSVLCFLCLSLPRTFRGATTTFDTTRFWPVQRATTHVRHHHL